MPSAKPSKKPRMESTHKPTKKTLAPVTRAPTTSAPTTRAPTTRTLTSRPTTYAESPYADQVDPVRYPIRINTEAPTFKNPSSMPTSVVLTLFPTHGDDNQPPSGRHIYPLHYDLPTRSPTYKPTQENPAYSGTYLTPVRLFAPSTAPTYIEFPAHQGP